jgi:hypothetical protein
MIKDITQQHIVILSIDGVEQEELVDLRTGGAQWVDEEVVDILALSEKMLEEFCEGSHPLKQV